MHHTFILNPYQFFICREGEYVGWNCQTHKQFAFDQSYLERLRQWSQGTPQDVKDIDYQLLAEKFLVPQKDDKSQFWKADILSQIFHVGTSSLPVEQQDSHQEWTQVYKQESENIAEIPPNLFIERVGEFVPLPAPNLDLMKGDFLSICRQRKTTRNFLNEPISSEAFSTILFMTFGWFHKDEPSELLEKGFQDLMIRKTSPAGGGLHCNEAYVIVQNVIDIPPGVYHYSVKRHGLTAIGPWNEKFETYLYGQYFGNQSAFGVFITAYLEKLWWKYPHSRSYRMALADSGHLSQMFHLCAAALKLDSWITGAFQDDDVQKLLGLEGPHQAPLLFVTAGYGTHEGVPNEFLA